MISYLLVRIIRWIKRDPDAGAWWELGLPRWTRPFWHALEFVDDLPWRLSNLRRFFRAAWYFNSCDWTPTFELLRVGLLANAETFERGRLVGADRAARECRIAAELIRRLQDNGERQPGGEYTFLTLDSSRRVYVQGRRRNESIGGVRGREYQDMLGHLIGRKMRTWWD